MLLPQAAAPATGPEAAFVAATIERCREDKGLAARLRRADNPATEYQSWEWLATWNVDLERPWVRLPWATLAAAIARAKPERNGKLRLGQAIGACFPDDRKGDQARMRLRRLLACNDTAEACRVLRPTLTLIESRVAQPIDYTRLLVQLRRFHFAGDSVKAQWAQEFYGQPIEEETAA